MDTFLKVLIIAMTGCAAALFLNEGSFRQLTAICCVCLCGTAAAELLQPILNTISHLFQIGGMNQAVTTPVMKAGAIGLLAQIAGAYCLDAGEKAIASALELSAVLSILYVSLPLIEAALDMLEILMGG